MSNTMSAVRDRTIATGMSHRQIKDILPHRYPMLLVDRVLDVEPGMRLTAVKAVTGNEPWYAAMPADAGEEAYAYPPVLLIESWGQAAGVLAGWDRPSGGVLAGQVLLFGGVSGVHFHGHVLPGDVIEHHVRLLGALADTVIVEGESVVGSAVVMEVARAVMAVRPADTVNPHRRNDDEC